MLLTKEFVQILQGLFQQQISTFPTTTTSNSHLQSNGYVTTDEVYPIVLNSSAYPTLTLQMRLPTVERALLVSLQYFFLQSLICCICSPEQQKNLLNSYLTCALGHIWQINSCMKKINDLSSYYVWVFIWGGQTSYNPMIKRYCTAKK